MDITDEILAIAKAYLNKVRKSGPEDIMAICPFHRKSDGSEETGPSFSMSLVKGVFFCHSCHAKGTLRQFLLNMGLDRASLQLNYGMVLEEAGKNKPVHQQTIQPKEIFEVTPVDEALLEYFRYDVSSMMPGFAPETLEHFDVGWDGWHNRIIFPIRNLEGTLVGLSGRATTSGQNPRYKVYDKEYKVWQRPERIGWNKRSVIWNADTMYPEMFLRPGDMRDTYVVVVEGFKAAMWLWQAGVRNTVAMLGSYLSWEHEWTLAEIGAPVYLFLDNNNAGWRGVIDAANRLDKYNFEVRMVEYPERLKEDEDAQPDDLTQEEVREQVALAPTYQAWRNSR